LSSAEQYREYVDFALMLEFGSGGGSTLTPHVLVRELVLYPSVTVFVAVAEYVPALDATADVRFSEPFDENRTVVGAY